MKTYLAKVVKISLIHYQYTIQHKNINICNINLCIILLLLIHSLHWWKMHWTCYFNTFRKVYMYYDFNQLVL